MKILEIAASFNVMWDKGEQILNKFIFHYFRMSERKDGKIKTPKCHLS